MVALRWGILGTGRIARRFGLGLQRSSTGTLVAVGSRTQEAADRFGADFGVERRHASYAALVDDPTVDAVYISLPNHLHAEWTVRCAHAGKHILCEKPLTINYAEAMQVIEEVRRCDVFLMEAFMYRCHPQIARLQELLECGTIGEVRLVEAAFSFDMGRTSEEDIRRSNPMGGGGILDVGCYGISFARLVAGVEPLEVTGTAYRGADSRVDEWAVASLRFPDGLLATITCGISLELESAVRIWGSDGHIEVPNPWLPEEGPNRLLVYRKGVSAPEAVVVDEPSGLYALEADVVGRSLPQRQAPPPCMTWDDSLGNMATLDRWRRSIGLVFDAEKAESLRHPVRADSSKTAMPYISIPGVDKRISRLIAGTMMCSIRDLPYTCAMLDAYVELGGNTLDTGRHYGDDVEQAIGAWMELRDNRDDVVIVGKGGHPTSGRPRLTWEGITADLLTSLDRLGTSYLDLYLLHRDDPAVPVGEILEWLNEHQQAGRIRAFGGSNWTPSRLEAANDYAEEHGLLPMVASSPNLSLAIPNEPPWPGCVSASEADLAWHRASQFPLLAWSSQAQGFLSGRYQEHDRSDSEMVRVWYSPDNFDRLRRVNGLADRHGVSPIAVALAWVLALPFPSFAIIGPRSLRELYTSAGALRLTLSESEVEWLRHG